MVVQLPPWAGDDPVVRASSWKKLLDRYCERVDAAAALQPDVVAGRRRLDPLEWDLETDLLDLIGTAFGDCDVHAEERINRGLGVVRGATSDMHVVLDPIDGSRLYREGSDRWTSTFAVFVRDEPVVGIVYHPATRRLFSAAHGLGAFVDGRPLSRGVGTGPNVVALRQRTGDGSDLARAADSLRLAGYEVENLECTSLKLVWLAQGKRAAVVKTMVRHDGVLGVWGLAAGLVVAQESGATARRLDGRPWRWQDGPVVVARQHVHDVLTAP